MLWILEHNVFLAAGHPLTSAVARAGHRAIAWDDDRVSFQKLPPETEEPTMFHGSLEIADKIAKLKRWRPGAYCNTAGFMCSAWYPRLDLWLLNLTHVFTTVRKFVESPETIQAHFGGSEVFVRPDSPLKPFSGRVVSLKDVTPAHLDLGFYYDDLDLPIVVAPPQPGLGMEWRFVVAKGETVASSAYVAEGRTAQEGDAPADAVRLANEIAGSFDAPDPVYMLDVIETPNGVRLLEINPFSGADLYRLDPGTVVDAVTRGLT